MANFSSGTSINYGSVLPSMANTVDGALFFLNADYIDNPRSPSNASNASISRQSGLYLYNFKQDFNSAVVGDQVGQGWNQLSTIKSYVELTGSDTGGTLPVIPMTGRLAIDLGTGTQTSALSLRSTSPGIHFRETDVSSNLQDWRLEVENSTFSIKSYNAPVVVPGTYPVPFTGSTLLNLFSVDRTGAAKILGNTVWHAGNMGSGSTLDSDLLDGQQGSFYTNSANHTGIIPVNRGGSGTTIVSQGGIVFGASTSLYGSTPAGTVGQILISNGTSAPQWMNQSSIVAAPTCTVSGVAPSSPRIGDQWFDDVTTLQTYVWIGSIWLDGSPSIGSSVGGAVVTVSGTAPSSPAVGDLWYENAVSNRCYIWNGSAWVDLSPVGPVGSITIGTTNIPVNSSTTTLIGLTSLSSNVLVTPVNASGGISINDRATASNAYNQYVTSNVFRIFSQTAAADRLTLDASGNLIAAGAMSAFSDSRLKDNITPIEGALDKLLKMSGVTFTWNNKSKMMSSKAGKEDIGVLASEVKEVFPMLVSQAAKDQDSGVVYDTVDYSKLVPVLIEAVRELSEQNKVLQSRISSLESFNIRF